VLRRPLESALHAAVGVVDEPAVVHRPPLVQRLFQRIEDKAGMRRAACPPADNLAGSRRLATWSR
jgi:hypothetical protein